MTSFSKAGDGAEIREIP